MINIYKRLIPQTIRRFFAGRLSEFIRKYKEPRMIWGYRDSSGIWRPRTRISDTVFFYHPERMHIGDNVFVWHYTILDGTGGLEVGEGTQIGAWVGIFTHSSHIAVRIYGDHYQEVLETEKKGYPISPVKIGRYVFIGAGSKVLPGVKIGDGVLISTGSVVTKDIDAFKIVAGNPAKVIGDTRDLDQEYLDDPQLRKWYQEWAEAQGD